MFTSPAAKPPRLHYDKEALLQEYRRTFGSFIRMLVAAVAVVVVLFFLFLVYLGGRSHAPATPFAETFKGRIDIEYSGTKLPMFGGPEKPEQKGAH